MKIYINKTNGVSQGNLSEIHRAILSHDSLNLEVIVQRRKKTRTSPQNRYWWACMTILSNDMGYRKNEIHEICKFKFLKREMVDEGSGEVFEYLASTSDLSTVEFCELVEEMIDWALTFNIVLPRPDEQQSIDL